MTMLAGIVPLFGMVPGTPEMMVILLIAVLLFGANKIPQLARSTGEAMGEFKKGRQELEDELEAELNDVQSQSAVENTVTETGNRSNDAANPGGKAE